MSKTERQKFLSKKLTSLGDSVEALYGAFEADMSIQTRNELAAAGKTLLALARKV